MLSLILLLSQAGILKGNPSTWLFTDKDVNKTIVVIIIRYIKNSSHIGNGGRLRNLNQNDEDGKKFMIPKFIRYIYM